MPITEDVLNRVIADVRKVEMANYMPPTNLLEKVFNDIVLYTIPLIRDKENPSAWMSREFAAEIVYRMENMIESGQLKEESQLKLISLIRLAGDVDPTNPQSIASYEYARSVIMPPTPTVWDRIKRQCSTKQVPSSTV